MDTTEKCKIFIIDDDDSVRSMIESILGHIGIDNLCSFRSALDAKKKFQDSIFPEFIFIDFLMPEMNGNQFIDWMHESFPHKDIGICIISGCTDLNEKEKRGSYFIPKPFSIQRIKDVLDDFYGKRIV